MIASSNVLKVAALTTAAALHIGLSGGFAPEIKPEQEGAAGAAQAAVGSSFADMSKGIMTAQAVETVAETVEPIQNLTNLAQPEPAPTETPTETAATPQLNSADKPAARPAQSLEITATQAAHTPALFADVAKPQKTQRVALATSTTSITPDQAAPTVSKRPKQRDPAKETVVAAKPKIERQPKPHRQAKGNASSNARKGAATGQKRAKAAVPGTETGTAKTSGNAAASNYPGKVMRRLARVQKVRGVARGEALIVFRIASNGGLAGASLRRSSGSQALDKAAIRAVHRAAPFPPPPQGAQRSFKILITGS